MGGFVYSFIYIASRRKFFYILTCWKDIVSRVSEIQDWTLGSTPEGTIPSDME